MHAVIEKERQRDAMVGQMQAMRQREQEAQQVAMDVEQRLRISKVQAMQRVQTYQRRQALRRIEEETQRTQALLAKRAKLQVCCCWGRVGVSELEGYTCRQAVLHLNISWNTQEERKKANMEASFQRQRVMDAMARLQRAKTGTQPDVERLLASASR